LLSAKCKWREAAHARRGEGRRGDIPAQYGATTVATVLGKNTRTGPAYPATPNRVFANSVPLTAGKEVVAVTLHVFAASVA
jgi:alpha-glucosidase